MARSEVTTNTPRGASTANVSWKAVITAWRHHHRQSAQDSLRRIIQAPLQNLMTTLVIGITLALPTLFGIAIDNLQMLGQQWDGSPRLSLYLKADSSQLQIDALQQTIKKSPGITGIQFISPEQGLADFEKESGIEGTMEMLDKNPLPPVLVITFENNIDTHRLEQLQTDWKSLDGVDVVQADLVWVKKLNQLLELARRMMVGLAALLGLGALLSVSNTIRLAIENRRSEIIVAKLVGATDAFVRRPFLYTGFWYGLLGGLIATMLVVIGYQGLITPVAELATLYQSDFVLQGLKIEGTIGLLSVGIALGMLGAWIAVGQHLHDMRPR
jgi:cell division transport system permease protein